MEPKMKNDIDLGYSKFDNWNEILRMKEEGPNVINKYKHSAPNFLNLELYDPMIEMENPKIIIQRKLE